MKDNNEHKARRGEKLQIPAGTWNNVLDATKDYKRNKYNPENAVNAGVPTSLIQSNLEILIRNESDYDLATSYKILRLTDIVCDTDHIQQSNRYIFEGETPTFATNKFAVVQQPLVIGDMGKAIISGLAFTRVHMVDLAHEYANPTPNVDGWLTSSITGQARILYFTATGDAGEAAADIYFAVVNIGDGKDTSSSSTVYADVIGPESATTGEFAYYTDPTGRFIGNTTNLRYSEISNAAGGNSIQVERVIFSVLMPGHQDESRLREYSYFYNTHEPFWSAQTLTFRDAVSLSIPSPGTLRTIDQTYTSSIRIGFDGTRQSTVSSEGGLTYEASYFNPDGGLSFVEKRYDFDRVGTSYILYTWYDSTRSTAVQASTLEHWHKQFTSLGVAGVSLGCFSEGLYYQKMTNVTDMAGTETLAQTQTKINSILAMLRSAGIHG